jgi:MFS family permease
MIILSAAFFVLTSAQSLTIIVIGGALYGIGAGIQTASAVYYIIESVENTASSLAIAIAMAFTSLDISTSPIIVNTLAGLFSEINGTSGLLMAETAAFFDAMVEYKCKLIAKLAKYYKPDILNFHDDWVRSGLYFFHRIHGALL